MESQDMQSKIEYYRDNVAEQINVLLDAGYCVPTQRQYLEAHLDKITEEYVKRADLWEERNGVLLPVSKEFEIIHDAIFNAVKNMSRIKRSFDYGDVKIFVTKSDDFMCRLVNDDVLRPLRRRIQDINAGDAFIVGSDVLCASAQADQDISQDSCPWLVRAVNGKIYNEEQICDVKRLFLNVSVKESSPTRYDKKPLVSQITSAKARSKIGLSQMLEKDMGNSLDH